MHTHTDTQSYKNTNKNNTLIYIYIYICIYIYIYISIMRMLLQHNVSEQIERIMNRHLYQLYAILRQHMKEGIAPGVEIERELWHGTEAASLENILTGGFNRAYCGKNGWQFLIIVFL